MGTVVSFDLRPPLPVAAALDQAIRWLHHVDDTFSTYRYDSQLNRLGRGEITLAEAYEDVRHVLARCMELTAITGGAFDAFDLAERSDSTLDPSAYVKGWSIEGAARILEEGGATTFAINAGGDVLLRGAPLPRPTWRVGVRHPEHSDLQAVALELAGPCGVATSATYERGAHIIDPATGQPTTALASATVVGPDLGVADAYATAVFVMGVPGLEWIEDQADYDAYLITHDGMAHWSAGLDAAAGTDGWCPAPPSPPGLDLVSSAVDPQ